MPAGDVITMLRTGDETAGAVFEFEALLPPRMSGPPAHRHLAEHERFEVVEGTLRVRTDRETRDLRAGESVVVPPGVVHSFANPTDEPVRLRTRETPAGQLEAQFRLMATAGRLPPVLELAQINARHGYSFLLAGMPEVPQRLLWRGLAGIARFRNRFG